MCIYKLLNTSTIIISSITTNLNIIKAVHQKSTRAKYIVFYPFHIPQHNANALPTTETSTYLQTLCDYLHLHVDTLLCLLSLILYKQRFINTNTHNRNEEQYSFKILYYFLPFMSDEIWLDTRYIGCVYSRILCDTKFINS